MGRITRKKAAEVAEALHIDEDAVLELGDENEALGISKGMMELQLQPTDREPLGQLEANSLESTSQSEDAAQELKKSMRGKKGSKKGAKAKKNNLAASTASQFDIYENVTEQPEILPNNHETTPSSASEKAAGVLLQDTPEGDPFQDTKSSETQLKATRSTRSNPASQEAEPKSLVDGIGQSREEQEAMKEELVSNVIEPYPVVHTDTTSQDYRMESEPAMQSVIDAPASPLPNAVPTVVSRLRADSPTKRSTSNKENIEPQEMASPQPTPSVTVLEPSTQQPSTPSDPIAALDALDDAVDSVNKDIPNVQTSPEKPKVKRDMKKAAPVVRGTKASQARISLAQNPDPTSKPPTLGQPRPSTTIGRSNSVKPSATSKPEPATKRATSASHSKPTKEGADREKKEVHIPHSKPRPVSLSFPTPPPRAKSTKAPTQSTFQLSGEAVAAKLKAAREARQQKEAEEQKKPSFKARPVPASLSKAPSVRQTTASKARESIMASKDSKTPSIAPNAAQKRVSSVTTKAPAPSKPRIVSSDTSRATTTISSKPASGDLSVRKRPSTTLANTSKPRSLGTSTNQSPNTSVQRGPSNPTKGTAKGKEVFNRAAAAKAAAEKEKHEKEAAAKKARADAAERGRQASRVWAEKQKKAGAAKKTSPTEEDSKDSTEAAGEEQPSPAPAETALVEVPAAASVEVV